MLTSKKPARYVLSMAKVLFNMGEIPSLTTMSEVEDSLMEERTTKEYLGVYEE